MGQLPLRSHRWTRRGTLIGAIGASVVVVLLVVASISPKASATGIVGNGINYIGLYTFGSTGLTGSKSFPTPESHGFGPVTDVNKSFTYISDGAISTLSIINLTSNGTQCYHLGDIYNTSTVDVLIFDAVCKLGTTSDYQAIV
jgi:hypothetical protein